MTAVAARTNVETGKVQRRKLRFETVEEAIAEARRLAALENAGKAECMGNWTVGQVLNHCGAWAEYAYKENPLKTPWVVRVIAGMMKGRFLNKGLLSGQKIPKVPGGTLAIEPVETGAGLARFEAAYARLARENPTHGSPVFGKLTREEMIKLNLRHSELHMGFVKG